MPAPSSPTLTREMILGTWKSKPTGSSKAVMEITFLQNHKCLMSVSVNGKVTNKKDKGTYTLTDNSAIIHIKMVNGTLHQANNYTLDTDQVKLANSGKALDFEFLHTTYWDRDGKKIDIDNAPNFGTYRLYPVPNMKQTLIK